MDYNRPVYWPLGLGHVHRRDREEYEGTGKEKEREAQGAVVRYDQRGYQELGPL